MGNGAHGADGRFFGAHRVTVESVPRLPTFPAAWSINDPENARTSCSGQVPMARCTSACEWNRSTVARRFRSRRGAENTFPIKILRQPLPSNGAATIMYRCPWCRRPRRYLYPLTLIAHRLVEYQGPRCRECAGFRWASQGTYQSVAARAFSALRQPGETRSSMRREPWDPRAVSHPRLLANEFPLLVFNEADDPRDE